MKNKFSIAIFSVFILGISFNLLAQEYKNFDLSKYYTPNYVRNSLDMSFITDGDLSNSDFSTNMTFNGNLTGVFRNVTNTRKKVTELTAVLKTENNFSSNKLDDALTSSFNDNFVSNNYFTVIYNKRYYNDKKQFLSFGGTFVSEANFKLNETKLNTNTNRKTTDNYGIQLIPYIGIGNGRLENVEDARQAILIIDDFNKKGILAKQLSENEIFQFAQQITKVKNKRFLDSRLHLIDEITTVDSILNSQNLLNDKGANYFTSLYDLWQYGALFTRLSGVMYGITLTPHFTFGYNNNLTTGNGTSSDYANNTNYAGYLNLFYNYEKPVNLFWQHTISATAIARYEHTYLTTNNILPTVLSSTAYADAYNALIQCNYQLGYYPDTRTNINAGVFSTYFYNSNRTNSSVKTSNNNFNLGLGTNVTYYVSPQLRIYGNANLSYNTYWGTSLATNNIYLNYNATLTYSFY